jgi:gluconolactonase
MFLLQQNLAAQDTAFDAAGIIKQNATPKLIARQFAFTEGPAVDRYGNIFFTDQPRNRIWKYDTKGKFSLFMNHAGRSNGLYFDHHGNIIACADEKNELWQISPSKKIKILLRNYKGQKLNGPNDLWADIKGGIYFTDPYYQRPYWKRTKPDIQGEKVYYLPKGKTEAFIVADDLKKPNGIVGTPDGKLLYIADIGDNKTYRYQIMPDGSLSNKQLFVAQGADGITLDEKGNLYLAGNGITVYDSAGKKIAYIPIKENWTANLCFGGKKKNLLFITASEAVYILPMRVKGVE